MNTIVIVTNRNGNVERQIQLDAYKEDKNTID